MKKKTSTRGQRKVLKDWNRNREGEFSSNGKVPGKYVATNRRAAGSRQNRIVVEVNKETTMATNTHTVTYPPHCMEIERWSEHKWIARLVGQRSVFADGRTEAEAVGKLYLMASDAIVAEIIEAHEKTLAEEASADTAAIRAQELRDYDDEQHRLAQEERED